MSSIEQAMEFAKLQTEVHELRAAANTLRHYLAGALCTVCGEPLGELELVCNEDDETMHAGCQEDQDGSWPDGAVQQGASDK